MLNWKRGLIEMCFRSGETSELEEVEDDGAVDACVKALAVSIPSDAMVYLLVARCK